ncbi:hypothetical protein ACFYW8_36790 [Streptomyces sp. NPDC002742]|uniref:hypothetical protein n=1 Tax=Streptomyces sp. NPDC002742 TaxID=3364663 RepID=UPI0036C1823D
MARLNRTASAPSTSRPVSSRSRAAAFTLYLAVAQPADAALPENLALAAVLHLAAVGAGAAMLGALVRTRLVSSNA